MSPNPTSQTSDSEPGQLLKELEQRQDEVLQQLDDLDAKLRQLLHEQGIRPEDEIDQELI